MEVKYIKVPARQKREDVERPVGDMATRKMLRAYLQGAIRLTSGKNKAEAKKIIQEYHQQTDMSEFKASPDALKVVEAKEKSLKEKASAHSLRAKVNYASDADVPNMSEVVSVGVASVATSMFGSVALADPNTLSATVMTAAVAYTAAKATKMVAATLSESKTPEQKKDAQTYANVKHAQLALKLLKKEIEAPLKAAERAQYKEEVAKLFAAGYGQPSGGFVQPVGVGVAANPAGQATAKTEKKSYWQEAMETFARFGNPSGGMVHNDLPAKDEKPAETAKAESAKEDKKSYWKEAMETFARFGNPSGGMVHNDIPAKDEKPTEPAKAEPAKEDKKSYWQEAMETFSRFGNPSGGMIHNDLSVIDEKVRFDETKVPVGKIDETVKFDGVVKNNQISDSLPKGTENKKQPAKIPSQDQKKASDVVSKVAIMHSKRGGR